MIILGINAYHGDSSACLLVDGEIICAIEEERIKRVKHWAGIPIDSIKWCLKSGDISFQDIDYIAVSRNPSSQVTKKILRLLTRKPSFSFIKDRFLNLKKIKDLKSIIANEIGVNSTYLIHLPKKICFLLK